MIFEVPGVHFGYQNGVRNGVQNGISMLKALESLLTGKLSLKVIHWLSSRQAESAEV